MDNNRNELPPEDHSQSAPERGRRPESASRRRFGQIALSGTVIATLYSQPLRAAGNCMPSGWVSGNTSLHPEGAQPCGGYTPGGWQGGNPPQPREDWADTLFNTVFPGVYEIRVDGEDRKATLLDAVSGPGNSNSNSQGKGNGAVSLITYGGDHHQLVRFGAAAYLNASYVPGYALTPDMVVKMVGDAMTTGFYTTNSGDTLTATQVNAFLENTMGDHYSFATT